MANIYHSDLDAFSIYHQTQESSPLHTTDPLLPALGHALAGSTGTAIANLAIYPLDLVTTRLQIQRTLRKTSNTADEGEYKGVFDAFKQIYDKEGGIKALYSGVVQSTTKHIVDAFLFFLFYNFLRERRLKSNRGSKTNLPAFDELAVGMLAGTFSKAFTTPISNIVTRKQTASLVSSRSGSTAPSPSVTEIAVQIRQEKGLQGFWSGYSASLVLTLNPSITFFLYETFKRVLLPRAQRDDPGARITFLMAAVSKSIASTITYPFSLAKARAQTSSKPPVDADTKSEAERMADSFEHVHNKGDAKAVSREAKVVAKNVAKHSTVFGTVLKIYREEGAEALYEGIWGEILKGFFSHGGTMLIKEAVHKVIIQAYFLLLKALNKYPSPAEIANWTKTAVQDAGGKMGGMAQDAVDGWKEAISGVSGMVQSAMGSGKEAVSDVGGMAKGAVQIGREVMGADAERASVISNNATEVVKNAGVYVVSNVAATVPTSKTEMVGVVESAREALGGKLENLGKTIKLEGDGK